MAPLNDVDFHWLVPTEKAVSDYSSVNSSSGRSSNWGFVKTKELYRCKLSTESDLSRLISRKMSRNSGFNSRSSTNLYSLSRQLASIEVDEKQKDGASDFSTQSMNPFYQFVSFYS